MKKITKNYEVYSFDELSKEAKLVAIEKHRHINVDDFSDWDTWVLEDKQLELESMGFNNVKIYYCGFWSQGDGACFTGTLDNDGLMKFIKHHKLISKYRNIIRALNNDSIYVNIKITHSGRYYHEYMTTTEDMSEMQDNTPIADTDTKLSKEWEQFMDWFDNRVYNAYPATRKGWLIDHSKNIYKFLEKAYDESISDEAVGDTLQNNCYEFLATGESYRA
jgi:hypothetical protein